MTEDIEKIRASRKKLSQENPRLMTLVKTVEELRFSHGFTRKQIFISLTVIVLDLMKKSAIEDDEIQLMRKLFLGISSSSRTVLKYLNLNELHFGLSRR